MSIISLQYQHQQPSQTSVFDDVTSRDAFIRNIYTNHGIEIPTIPPTHQNRFVPTHEIWGKDDSNPEQDVKYDTTQLSDSLVCVSMSNEIRRTIASLTQNTTEVPSSNQHPATHRNASRMTGTTKLFGKSLLTEGKYKASMSQPTTRQNRYDYREMICTSAPEKRELDLRLSPVNFRKSREEEQPVNETCDQLVPKKEHNFRLPYRECLTKSKTPSIHILEVECAICGQIGSIYRHRADKTKCGRCGNLFAMKQNNKFEYQFKITRQFSGQEVLDKMRRHTGKSMRRLL